MLTPKHEAIKKLHKPFSPCILNAAGTQGAGSGVGGGGEGGGEMGHHYLVLTPDMGS